MKDPKAIEEDPRMGWYLGVAIGSGGGTPMTDSNVCDLTRNGGGVWDGKPMCSVPVVASMWSPWAMNVYYDSYKDLL